MKAHKFLHRASWLMILASQLLLGCGGSSTGSTVPPAPPAPALPTIIVNAPATALASQAVPISATATTPGGLASVTATATGPGVNITVSYTPSEIGCTLGALTCTVSQVVTIPVGSSGTYSYTVQVTDQLGRVGSQSGSIIVN